MWRNSRIAPALEACDPFPARKAVLISMAYQMGIDGLAGFINTLKNIAAGRWNDAANWHAGVAGQQTPKRLNAMQNRCAPTSGVKEYS